MGDINSSGNMDFMETKNTGFDASSIDPSWGERTFSFLQSPNFLRAMAQTGAAISPEGSIGRAVGNTTANYIQEKASAAAAAKMSGDRKNYNQEFLSALRGDPTGSNLLGDPDDPNTLNKITMDNKGIKVDMPNPGRTNPYSNLQDPPAELLGTNAISKLNNTIAGQSPGALNSQGTGDISAQDVLGGPKSPIDPNAPINPRQDLRNFFRASKI